MREKILAFDGQVLAAINTGRLNQTITVQVHVCVLLECGIHANFFREVCRVLFRRNKKLSKRYYFYYYYFTVSFVTDSSSNYTID